MGYARLRPRAYNFALRLRPGAKKTLEGINSIKELLVSRKLCLCTKFVKFSSIKSRIISQNDHETHLKKSLFYVDINLKYEKNVLIFLEKD